jgi:hypothetical protein
MRLDLRTVDQVKPGEQQPETDHLMQAERSRTNYFRDESFRDAVDSGYFSYDLLTGGETNLLLRVRFQADKGRDNRTGAVYHVRLMKP